MEFIVRLLFISVGTALICSPAYADLHDRGGGLIFDDKLNVTWLQDANYAETLGLDLQGSGLGLMNFYGAKSWIADFRYYDTVRGVTWDGWRLPKIVDTGQLGCDFGYSGTDCGYNVQTTVGTNVFSEMASLYYDTLGNRGFADSNGVGSSPPYLTNVGPFTNLQADSFSEYWSGVFYRPDNFSQCCAFSFRFYDGYQAASDWRVSMFVWPVRDGDVGAVAAPPAVWLIGSCLIALLSVMRSTSSNGRG